LVESFQGFCGPYIVILPQLHSIENQLSSQRLRGKVARLCWDLIEGLACLHKSKLAHLDIKPSNLVCDDAHRLQIVNFDVALEVKDQDQEIYGYRGTRGWTAPEVGKPASTYSPIKADRWSCGHVILHLLDRVGDEDSRLSMIAGKLKAKVPQQRPSLLEWHKWLEGSPSESDAANILKEDRKDREIDEDMEPTRKKPRLASPERSMGE
jgi:serine/threonine protein kinase